MALSFALGGVYGGWIKDLLAAIPKTMVGVNEDLLGDDFWNEFHKNRNRPGKEKLNAVNSDIEKAA